MERKNSPFLPQPSSIEKFCRPWIVIVELLYEWDVNTPLSVYISLGGARFHWLLSRDTREIVVSEGRQITDWTLSSITLITLHNWHTPYTSHPPDPTNTYHSSAQSQYVNSRICCRYSCWNGQIFCELWNIFYSPCCPFNWVSVFVASGREGGIQDPGFNVS